MDAILARHEITRTVSVGLATDYCVQYTSVDASKFNYHSYVIADAVRAVGGANGTAKAFGIMKEWDVTVEHIHSNWFKELCPKY